MKTITYLELLSIMSDAIDNGQKAEKVAQWAHDSGIPYSVSKIRRHVYVYRFRKKSKTELPPKWKTVGSFEVEIPSNWNPKNKNSEIPIGREKKSVKHFEDGINFIYDGYEHSITTIEQAIEFFQIDTDKYRIVKPEFNVWQTPIKRLDGTAFKTNNYQVKIRCEEKEPEFDLQDALKRIEKASRKVLKQRKQNVAIVSERKVGVVCIADLHIGALTGKHQGVLRTQDYSMETLISYLRNVSDIVNNQRFSEVHLACLGDFIESFTGLNHINSFQGTHHGMSFGNLILAAQKILDDFFKEIKNLSKIYMVSGNHDRLSANRNLDVKGDAALLLNAHLQARGYPTEHHPLLLNPEIDGIQYIFDHGHRTFTKKGIANTILRYGNQNLYNVAASGHLHCRNTTKEFHKSQSYVYDAVEGRAVTVASLFTGNFFSESIGYTSTAGFSIFEANSSKDNVHHLEVGLPRVKF